MNELKINKLTKLCSAVGEDPADVDDECAGQEHQHHQPRQEQEGDRGPQNQDHWSVPHHQGEKEQRNRKCGEVLRIWFAGKSRYRIFLLKWYSEKNCIAAGIILSLPGSWSPEAPGPSQDHRGEEGVAGAEEQRPAVRRDWEAAQGARQAEAGREAQVNISTYYLGCMLYNGKVSSTIMNSPKDGCNHSVWLHSIQPDTFVLPF